MCLALGGLGLGQGDAALHTVGAKQRGRDLTWGTLDREFFETSCRKLTREQPAVRTSSVKDKEVLRVPAYGNQPSADAGNRKKNTVRRRPQPGLKILGPGSALPAQLNSVVVEREGAHTRIIRGRNRLLGINLLRRCEKAFIKSKPSAHLGNTGGFQSINKALEVIR